MKKRKFAILAGVICTIISAVCLHNCDNGTIHKVEAYAGYCDNYYSDTDAECYEKLVVRDADDKIIGYNDAVIQEIVDKDSKDITSEERKALALLFVGEDRGLDEQELTRIQSIIIDACYDLTNTENYVDIHFNHVTLHIYEKNGLFDMLLAEIKNMEAGIYEQLDILSSEELIELRRCGIWNRTEQCLVLLDILDKAEGAVIPEFDREKPIIITRDEDGSMNLDFIDSEYAYAGYYTMDSHSPEAVRYENHAMKSYSISRLKIEQ